jgi:hypothetical protein
MTTFNYGDSIFLLSVAHNKYISVDKDGKVDASHKFCGDHESLLIGGGKDGTPVPLNGRITLRSAHNKLITVTRTGELIANRDSADLPENFVVVDVKNRSNTESLTSNHTINLMTHMGMLVAVEPDGKVQATKMQWDYSWDQFNVVLAYDPSKQGSRNIANRTILPQDTQSVTTGMSNLSLQNNATVPSAPTIEANTQLQQQVPPNGYPHFYGFPPQGFAFPPQGMIPPQGIPPQGMPPQGIPPQGIPPQGIPPQGIPPQGMPPQGFGFPMVPFLPHGMPPQGFAFPPQGIPPQGVPPQGIPPQGMPPQGMIPPQGIPPQGYPYSPYTMSPQQVPSSTSPTQGTPQQAIVPQPQMIPMQQVPMQQAPVQQVVKSNWSAPPAYSGSLPLTVRKGIRDNQAVLDKNMKKISEVVGRQVYLDLDWAFLENNASISDSYKGANLAKFFYENYIEILTKTLCKFLEDDMNKRAFLQHFTNNWIQFGIDSTESHMKNHYYHYTHVTKEGNIKIWVKPTSYGVSVNYPSVGEDIEDDLLLDGWPLIAARNVRDKQKEIDKILSKISSLTGFPVEFDVDWKWLLAYDFGSGAHTRYKKGDILADGMISYLESLAQHLEKFLADEMCKEALLEVWTGRKIQFGVDSNENICKGYHYTQITPEGNLKIWCKPNTYQVNVNYPFVGNEIESQL